MKKIVITILIIIVIAAAWYGFSIYRWNSMVDSGRPVLLINQDEGNYTFSDFINRDEFDRSYKVAGYYDEMSKQEIEQKTQGLELIFDVNIIREQIDTPDPRRPIVDIGEVDIPEENEKQQWDKLVDSLLPEQRSSCDALLVSSTRQYCLVRHFVFNAIQQSLSKEECGVVFVENQREECETDVENRAYDRVPDQNNNQIVDLFEMIPPS